LGKPGKTPETERETSQSTAEKIAEKHHVSPRTVERAADFADAVDKIGEEQGPEAKAEILAGKSGMTKSEIRQLSEMEKDEARAKIEEIKSRKKKQQPKKPATSNGKANGRVVFDDRKVTETFALLVRLLGQRKDAKGDHPERLNCHDRLDEALAAFTRWQRVKP
jgi:hypothetical protein